MPIWIQTSLIILAVLGSAAFLAKRGWATLHGKKGGSCCAMGCGAHEAKKDAKGQGVAFLPLELLSKRK